jgi:hypothetical protein
MLRSTKAISRRRSPDQILTAPDNYKPREPRRPELFCTARRATIVEGQRQTTPDPVTLVLGSSPDYS